MQEVEEALVHVLQPVAQASQAYASKLRQLPDEQQEAIEPVDCGAVLQVVAEASAFGQKMMVNCRNPKDLLVGPDVK